MLRGACGDRQTKHRTVAAHDQSVPCACQKPQAVPCAYIHTNINPMGSHPGAVYSGHSAAPAWFPDVF